MRKMVKQHIQNEVIMNEIKHDGHIIYHTCHVWELYSEVKPVGLCRQICV